MSTPRRNGITEREKSRASIFGESATFGVLGFSSSANGFEGGNGLARVAISTLSSSKHPASCLSCEGSINGSSPWMLMTTSAAEPRLS